MCSLSVSFTSKYVCICVGLSCKDLLLSLTLISDLLPLVIFAMIIGYIDRENQYASSEVKFAIAIGSIIPLSYYIGMGIARWVVFISLKLTCTVTLEVKVDVAF